MARFHSIVSRILSLHIIVVGSASLLLPLLLYLMLVSETKSLHRDAMHEQADRIAALISVGADERWSLNLPEALLDFYSEAYGRYSYAVLDRQGHVLFTSRSDHSAVFILDQRSSAPEYIEAHRGAASIAGVSVPKTIAGHDVWIEVAEDLAHRDVLIDDVVANFFPTVAWITVPILLALLGFDVAIVRRALRPVLQASQQAAEIGPRRTDVRLPVAAIPREIRPLVDAVNQALDRLEQGFRVQREFAADAAHELRTPLAILRTRIDMLTDKDASKRLRDDVEAMSRTVSQLLDLAELDAAEINSSMTADLRAVATDVVEFIAPLAVGQGKEVALFGAEHAVEVIGDGEMIARAIRNLTENAIKHTAPGTTVEIAIEDSGTIRVRDHGPGIAEGERELLFQRFWRRDRTRTGNAGLGLSIVQRIVEAHGGAITFNNLPGGGAEFSVTFPRRGADGPA